MKNFLFFIRGFFPSWKFFDANGEVLSLWLRRQSRDGIWSDWILASPKLSRHWTDIFESPEINWRHNCDSLLQNLRVELSDESILPEEKISFQLVKNWAQFEQQKKSPLKKGENFQFRISSAVPGASAEDILISAEYGVG